jgi:hypothetical protein
VLVLVLVILAVPLVFLAARLATLPSMVLVLRVLAAHLVLALASQASVESLAQVAILASLP